MLTPSDPVQGVDRVGLTRTPATPVPAQNASMSVADTSPSTTVVIAVRPRSMKWALWRCPGRQSVRLIGTGQGAQQAGTALRAHTGIRDNSSWASTVPSSWGRGPGCIKVNVRAELGDDRARSCIGFHPFQLVRQAATASIWSPVGALAVVDRRWAP